MSFIDPLIEARAATIHVKAEAETKPDTCAMARRSTRRSTELLVLVALVHVGRHGFVVAPFSAPRVHSSVRPSGIVKTRVFPPAKEGQMQEARALKSRFALLLEVGADQPNLDGDFFECQEQQQFPTRFGARNEEETGGGRCSPKQCPS